jgi:Terminase large subunit, T4likevirus-type, N-terminal/Terminase RNaseH-like domain
MEVDLSKLRGYNGNALLKRSNQKIEWTPELLTEYVKCSEDVIYFTEKYMKIINIDKGLVSFKLYDYQKEMLKSMQDNRFTIIATARQAGKSTVTCAFVLWYIIFHPEKTVALLANKGETAREILGRIQLAYQHLPKWLQQGVKEWNKGSMELENDSRVLAAATSSDAIRGYSINLLFIDEAAFIENWDTFFTSVYPTISSGQESKIVLVSTPNGLNHFYALWTNAKENRNGYNPIQVTYDKVPGRDEKWKEQTLAAMNFNFEKFEQEYCVEFMGSSGTLIAGWKLKELVHQTPIGVKDGLTVYQNPIPNHRYALIADVSEGKGLDYSAFHIVDVTQMPYKQVVVYRNNMVTPLDYAEVIHRLAIVYNRAPVLVEINNMGAQVSYSLHYDFEYDNILFTENAGRNGKKISTGFGAKVDMGVRTTVPVKANGCSLLKLLVEQNQLIINDFHTIEELARFSKKGKSYEAEEGAHDDLVMGLVLFSWLSEQQFFKDYTDINTLMRLRDKTDEEIMNDLSPFGFVDDGRELEEIIEPPRRSGWMSDPVSDDFL